MKVARIIDLMLNSAGLLLGVYWFGWWFLVPAFMFGVKTQLGMYHDYRGQVWPWRRTKYPKTDQEWKDEVAAGGFKDNNFWEAYEKQFFAKHPKERGPTK